MIFTVQINGKNKSQIFTNPEVQSARDVEDMARAVAKGYQKGRTIKKIVFGGRVINVILETLSTPEPEEG